jgi:tetratricopeptide (TPR) repeat protein
MTHAVGAPLKPEPPFRVALEWLAGPRDMPAMLYVRLLPALPPPRHRLSPPATNPPPLNLAAPADWSAALELQRQDPPATAAQPWTSGWKITAAPKAAQLQIQPGSFHQLSCVVEAAGAPPPGALVMATVKLGDLTVQSAPLTVPPPPGDAREATLAGVAAALAAGDTASALAVADRWIAAEPARHEGYWCRGLTLEDKGDTAGALGAYRNALERYPKPADSGSGWEPPTRLWRKLEALEKQPSKH